ncbi:MAG: response regulator [Eubacteriales bacterium]|nr:response regulator [Eubacteriales bacterium]
MMKILIVEDEYLEQRTLYDVLRRRMPNTEVMTADDGLKAVELSELWRPDVILMDIEIPGVNGLEATKRIQAMLPRCKVIFITAYDQFIYAQEAVRLGACDYVLKPIEDDALIAAVERAVRLVEREQDLAQYVSVILHPGEELDITAEQCTGKQQEVMQQVDKYLGNNYMYDISMESVAEIVHLSPSHFSKLFKQCFGLTFIERLTAIRIDTAKKLLSGTTKSTREIGVLVGYPNLSYFTSKFKKETGYPPAEYRKMNGN